MDALIDEVLETLLHSAIWRSTAHMSLATLIAIAVIAFIFLAYRRTRRGNSTGKKRRGRFHYRSRYRK